MTRTTRMLYLEEISDCDENREKKVGTEDGVDRPTRRTEGDASENVDIPRQEKDRKCEKFPENSGITSTTTTKLKTMMTTSSENRGFTDDENTTSSGDVNNVAIKTSKLGRLPHGKIKTAGVKVMALNAFVQADMTQAMEETLLYNVLRPLFFFMKLSGIFFLRKRVAAERGFCGWIKDCSGAQAHCICVCFVLIFNFIRSLAAFESSETFGTVLFFKLLVCIFFYEAASRALLAYMACRKKKTGLCALFVHIESVCYPDLIIPYEHSLRRTMKLFLVMTGLVCAANVGVICYGILGPAEVRALFNIYLVPISEDAPGIILFQGFLLLVTLFNTLVAILSLTFYTIVCYILYKEFEYLCRTLAMKIKEDGQFTDDLEKFRQRHQKRCKLVEEADQMFKYYIANTYLTNVPLLCLLLYSGVYAEGASDFVYRFITIFRLIYVLGQMMVLSVVATMINDQAHAPLADLYSIRVQSCTRERQLEVAMFLNKLTGTSIGLTAWDMFVINKPTVLTVFGMILTYFFLLMQFQHPPQSTTICNCVFTFYNGTNTTSLGLPATP